MIAQLPNTRMPDESPKAKISAGMMSHRLKVIKIKLMELIKKPEIIKAFSANCGNLVIILLAVKGLIAKWSVSIKQPILQV